MDICYGIKISDNDIAVLDFSDGKALITFKKEGTESIYFTANDSVTSDSTIITVIDKDAQLQREKEEAEQKAAEEEKRKAEEEAARRAEEERISAEREAAQKAEEERIVSEQAAQQQSSAQVSQQQVSPIVPQPQAPVSPQPQEQMVWISATGSKYHSKSNCGQMDPSTSYQMALSEAQASGYEPCKRCH